ncbi:YtzH-like family protein [Gracilibacillus dipsosauri]|uniref:YtzH-like protein n=1 Tax=Gracilibacillus dipsosauri TaxID=178340 RepID=A0A317L4Q4_9BACI|nr:YtzH-like family protein [Gracilibacillus dipsosauri]PWU70254.1 hypothetical protein DLJ74_01275 [Gracilibacillus dipsosauri]
MTLNTQHQLDLLHDLLSLHAEEGCGSSSECEQIARLVESLQQKTDLPHSKLMENFTGIYQYGTDGANSEDLDQHIINNQTSIQGWLETIKDSNY